MMHRSRRSAAATLVVISISCTSTNTSPDPDQSTTSASVSTIPSPIESPSESVEPIPDPVPARAPRGIAAITESGDVVVIDLDALATRTIASFPPAQAGEPDIAVSSFLTGIAVLPDGRILISSCCEPAAGYIRILSERGRESGKPLGGDDPEVDPSGRYLAVTFLQSLAILPASLRRGDERYIDGRGRFSPLDPGWSPDGDQLIFSLVRRLALVEVTAGSLTGAQYLESRAGTYWGSTAYPRSGPLAVEIDGNPSQLNQGLSRIVRVDFDTDRRRVLVSSTEAITDLATDRAGTALVWVDGGTIHRRVGEVERTLGGEYVNAAFIPG